MSEASTETDLEEQYRDYINCDRPFQRCDVCKEEWFRGTCSTPRLVLGTSETRIFCYHDDAPSMYWKHIRESEVHQAILNVQTKGLYALIDALPETVSYARQHKKLLQDPAFRGLQRLFQ